MQRKNAEQKYKWDIDKLYPSIDAWRKDLKKIVEMTEEESKLKGQLHNKDIYLKREQMGLDIGPTVDKVLLYTYLSELDNSNIEYQNMNTELQQAFHKCSIMTSWVKNEVKEIGKEKILSFIEGTEFEVEKMGVEIFFKNTKYILEENVEKALSTIARSRGAVSEMYEKITLADKVIPEIEYKGKKQKLTMNLYKEILEDSDPKEQKLRRDASRLNAKAFNTHKHSLAYIYNSMWDDWYDTHKLRNIDMTFLASKLDSLEIPEGVYHTLIKVARNNTKDNQLYFKTIRDILIKKYDIKEPYTTDSGLRLSSIKDKISVDEARETIFKAFEKYASKEYNEKAREALDWGKVDYYEDENKYTGGFMASRVYTKPYILMNWTFDFDSLSTLAHEAGHAIHTLFAEKQHPTHRSYPIYLAEIASVVAEEMLTQYLLDSTDDKEMKLHLLIEKATRIYGLFYRQTQFADFELQVSKMAEKQVPLNAENLAKLFKKIDDEYTGDDIFKRWDNKLSYAWTRISHFFQSPFYVYQYSTCAVAALHFFKELKNGNKKMLDDFLTLGGSDYPDKILKEVGIDLEKEETYEAIVTEFKETILEIRKLALNE